MRAKVFALAAIWVCTGCARAEESYLPAGFLEFLGTMVEADGEWVDPLTLQTSADETLADMERVKKMVGFPSEDESAKEAEVDRDE